MNYINNYIYIFIKTILRSVIYTRISFTLYRLDNWWAFDTLFSFRVRGLNVLKIILYKTYIGNKVIFSLDVDKILGKKMKLKSWTHQNM